MNHRSLPLYLDDAKRSGTPTYLPLRVKTLHPVVYRIPLPSSLRRSRKQSSNLARRARFQAARTNLITPVAGKATLLTHFSTFVAQKAEQSAVPRTLENAAPLFSLSRYNSLGRRLHSGPPLPESTRTRFPFAPYRVASGQRTRRGKHNSHTPGARTHCKNGAIVCRCVVVVLSSERRSHACTVSYLCGARKSKNA